MNPSPPPGGFSHRFWEIDMLRGLALVGMILYHLLFDLDYMGFSDIDCQAGPARLLALATASLFLALVGLSLSLSAWRRLAQGMGIPVRHLLRRGAWIFLLGLGISVVTYVHPGHEIMVIFGVLHLIGLSIILGIPFLGRPRLALAMGLIVISLGGITRGITVTDPWLIWLGITPPSFSSLDYFPLLPWFGVVLIGMVGGDVLYGGYRRNFPVPLPHQEPRALGHLLTRMGRHSLMIYLLHQPVLLSLLLAASYLTPSP